MFEWLQAHIVSVLVFFPLLISLVVFLPVGFNTVKWISMLGSLLNFVFSCFLWSYFDSTSSEVQFSEMYSWFPQLGIKYFVGVDGLNLLLIMLTTFLTPLVILSTWNKKKEFPKAFLSLILALECGMLGALVAFDMIFFYFFWEIMLIPLYFIIGIWGGSNRIYATTQFIIYTVLGSLLMLVAAIVLYFVHYNEFGFYSTSLLDLYKISSLSTSMEQWLFLGFAFAFAIKVPIWPFHTWLPHAHTEAPTEGSVLLAGVLLKMGTYGFIRFALPLFPHAIITFAPMITLLGVVGIIYGAFMAWMQNDAKKLVAYSSVSHLGFVIVGSLAFTQDTLSVEALTGAIYQMINHGISAGALFFLVGMIYERCHTRELSEFGGLAAVMPWYAVMLIIITLSAVGLPGTGGFVGEFLILLGTFKANPIVGCFASLGVLLGAIYMLKLCLKVLFGPIHIEKNKSLKDLNFIEASYITPLAVLVIVMGIFPNVFLDKSRASISYLAHNYENYHIVVKDKKTGNKLLALSDKEIKSTTP